MIKNIEMNVTVSVDKKFKIRLALAKWLIRLAGWILGAGIRVDASKEVDKNKSENC